MTHHISSDRMLLTVGGSLFILTILTAAVHYMGLPEPWSIIAALAIAILKASLVILFFMHVYWDNKIHSIVLLVSLAFFAILVGITMLDVFSRPVLHHFF